MSVVPYVGTGIEIYTCCRNSCRMSVVPYVGTWIEIFMSCSQGQGQPVVPYVGTWIEMQSTFWRLHEGSVVPYVGTWIEIIWIKCRKARAISRSLRGNVDRNQQGWGHVWEKAESFPTWERG